MSFTQEHLQELRQKHIGETSRNNQGYLMSIVEYTNASNIIVEFEDGFKKKTTYANFRHGSVKKNETKYAKRCKNPQERIGEKNINAQDCIMKIVKYIDSHNIIVEFEDGKNTQTKTTYKEFKNGYVHNPNLPNARMLKGKEGEQKRNFQGCLMELIEYNGDRHVKIKFLEPIETILEGRYCQFKNGTIKNPYYPEVFDSGFIGIKYPSTINGKTTKEYAAWLRMLRRSCDENYKEKFPCYKDVSVCKEWLSYENFYEWLHSQENFEQWSTGDRWAIDKDILKKGNKKYCPEYCCLVPQYINNLFIRNENRRGDTPLGVIELKKQKNFRFNAYARINNKSKFLGNYCTAEEAFSKVKQYTEKVIQRIAKESFDKNYITYKCYQAMMSYEVKITD